MSRSHNLVVASTHIIVVAVREGERAATRTLSWARLLYKESPPAELLVKGEQGLPLETRVTLDATKIVGFHRHYYGAIVLQCSRHKHSGRCS